MLTKRTNGCDARTLSSVLTKYWPSLTQSMMRPNTEQRCLNNILFSLRSESFRIKEKLEALRIIRMYLDAAKAKVEVCHEPQKGMSLYNYALKLLMKMECVNC